MSVFAFGSQTTKAHMGFQYQMQCILHSWSKDLRAWGNPASCKKEHDVDLLECIYQWFHQYMIFSEIVLLVRRSCLTHSQCIPPHSPNSQVSFGNEVGCNFESWLYQLVYIYHACHRYMSLSEAEYLARILYFSSLHIVPHLPNSQVWGSNY